jgi:predicted Zn-dependent protease
MTDLGDLAQRVVEATLAAGVGEAEAYASEEAGREVRVHGGEVESLTAATQRGVGVRAWIGGRVGYAYGTDASGGGIEALAGRATEAARVADEDEFAAAPAAGDAAPALDGLSDPSVAAWPAGDAAELALAVERAALSTRRIASRSPPRPGSQGAMRLRVATPTCRRWPRATEGGRRGLASVWRGAPPASIRRRSAAKAPSARWR